MSKWRSSLDALASVALIGASVTLIAGSLSVTPPTTTRRQPQVPKELQSIADAAVLGNPDAKIVIIEYSDYECTFCAAFARDTLPVLQARYVDTGTVKLVFRHFPLPNHVFARKAAEAAECARGQGKFWEFHDRLLSDPKNLDLGRLRREASLLGLDELLFANCLTGQAVARLNQDLASARALGFTGTPAFLIGTSQGNDTVRVTNVITGAQPAAEFSRVIDGILSDAKGGG